MFILSVDDHVNVLHSVVFHFAFTLSSFCIFVFVTDSTKIGPLCKTEINQIVLLEKAICVLIFQYKTSVFPLPAWHQTS